VPRYIVLMNWTEEGVKNVKGTVERSERGREAFKALGVDLVDVYWTVGPYDSLSIVDAPDDERLSAALLAAAGQGTFRTTTMRAFTADEMRDVLQQMP
jgi:uncharacterized protein with GYD domain